MIKYLSYAEEQQLGKAKGKLKTAVKKAKGKVVKVAAAPMRAAFLVLISTNFLHLAYKFNLAKETPAGAKKIQDFWQKFRGDNNKLNNAIKSGMNVYNKLHPKKRSKINGVTAAAAITAATPVLIAATPILKSIIGKKADEQTAEDTAAAEKGVEDFKAENTPEEKEDAAKPFYKKPAFYIPAGLLGLGLVGYGISKAIKK